MTTAVIYDTEFTTWEGAMQANWSLPNQHRELVQIGAVRIDAKTGTELDEFSILLRPRINPVLSDYFIDLTGISNEDIRAKGHDFAAGWRRFLDFAGTCPTAAYGLDADVARENLKLNDMPNAASDFDSLNIAPWFHEHGAAYGIKAGVNSGRLAAVLGLEIKNIQEHDALHDARSIAAAYRFLRENGAPAAFA